MNGNKKGILLAAAMFVTILSVTVFIGTTNPQTGLPEPITVGEQTITFPYTDDNTGENLHIYIDRETYTNGISSATVYAAVVNKSSQTQEVQLAGYFRDDKKKISDVWILKDIERQSVEPVIEQVCTDVGTTTECIEQQTGWATTTDIVKSWETVPFIERTAQEILNENQSLKDIARKTVADFRAGRKTAAFTVPPEGVIYYKLLVQFPVNSTDSFFLEAYGDKKGYGNLF